MNETLIAGYASYVDAEEFGAGTAGDAPGSVESVGWTALSVAAVYSVHYEC